MEGQLEKQNPRKLLSESDEELLRDYHQSMAGLQNPIQTEQEATDILQNPKDVLVWRLISVAMSRMQNRYVVLDGSITVWDECRNRALVFLQLSGDIMDYLDPVKHELEEKAEAVLAATRMKLNVLNAFAPICKKRSLSSKGADPVDNWSSIAVNTFLCRIVEFNKDAAQPKNVADAYPSVDDSVSRLPDKSFLRRQRPDANFVAASCADRGHDIDDYLLHHTHRFCLAAIIRPERFFGGCGLLDCFTDSVDAISQPLHNDATRFEIYAQSGLATCVGICCACNSLQYINTHFVRHSRRQVEYAHGIHGICGSSWSRARSHAQVSICKGEDGVTETDHRGSSI